MPDDFKWTRADPAWIGKRAIYHGAKDLPIIITGVSDDLLYYWSFGEIYPSFQVELKED